MELDKSLSNLYKYMRGNCNYSNHSGIAIYFCIEKECSNKYLCSECMIENPNHFTSHIKYFVPLDNKNKFCKFFDLNKILHKENDLGEVISDNNNLEQYKEILIKFFGKLKEIILNEMELLISNNIDTYLKNHEEGIKEREKLNHKNSQNKISISISNQIDEFINKNDKEKFSELCSKLTESVKVENEISQDEECLLINNIKFNNQSINKKLNEIIEENILLNNLAKTYISKLDNSQKAFSFCADSRNSKRYFPIRRQSRRKKSITNCA